MSPRFSARDVSGELAGDIEIGRAAGVVAPVPM